MEDKARVDPKSAKGDIDIPVPVTHRPSPATSPRRKWGRPVVVIFAFLCTLRLFSNVEHIHHNGHEEQEHGMVNAMTHAPNKGHVLKGKKAEQLFLCVAAHPKSEE